MKNIHFIDFRKNTVIMTAKARLKKIKGTHGFTTQ